MRGAVCPGLTQGGTVARALLRYLHLLACLLSSPGLRLMKGKDKEMQSRAPGHGKEREGVAMAFPLPGSPCGARRGGSQREE